MPDYSGCVSENCSKRKTCARYLMKFGQRQSVIKPEQVGDSCPMYWFVDKGVPFQLDETKMKVPVPTKRQVLF